MLEVSACLAHGTNALDIGGRSAARLDSQANRQLRRMFPTSDCTRIAR